MNDYTFQTTMCFRVNKKDPQGRIFVTVFCGDNPRARENVGELVFTDNEYQRFFAALRLGTHAMLQITEKGTHVPLEVTVEGERMALSRYDVPDDVHFPVPEPP